MKFSKLNVSRRGFLGLAGAAAASVASAPLLRAKGIPKPASSFKLAEIERARVLKAAQNYVHQEPVTITAFTSGRSSGGKHDYFSEGDYWWPDPKNPDGPYIQRDGMSNPNNFNEHRHALIRLSLQVPALAAAWSLTKDRRYSAAAAKYLRAWFLDESTRMNPNLEYAQAVTGRFTGRGTGIIDTIHLVEVARAIPVLARSGALSANQQQGIKKWFADYLQWMTTSDHGKDERDAKNNHGTCWVMQVAEFADYIGNRDLTEYCRDRFKTVLLPGQLAADGSFPQELRRTKPYNYSLFNLDAMATVCQILSPLGDNLFDYTLSDGRSMAKAMAFMVPYIANKQSWPFPHDVQYFDDFPVRQSCLLFTGLALSKPEYISLWRTLNPDPTVDEVIRNYPIRQPLLWVKGSINEYPAT